MPERRSERGSFQEEEETLPIPDIASLCNRASHLSLSTMFTKTNLILDFTYQDGMKYVLSASLERDQFGELSSKPN